MAKQKQKKPIKKKEEKKEVDTRKTIKKNEMEKQIVTKNNLIEKCVWAKLRFCSFWPARICDAPPELEGRGKKKVCVFFFGSKNL